MTDLRHTAPSYPGPQLWEGKGHNNWLAGVLPNVVIVLTVQHACHHLTR